MSHLHHGKNWDGRDLSGWWISEKLDGCRAWWDGAQMWTRSGREIVLPDWFRAQLPEGVELDGEMWAGHYGFHRASVAVRMGRIDRDIEFVAFDTPAAPGDWSQRMAAATKAIGTQVNVRAVHPVVAASTWHALRFAAAVLNDGGEGIMARSPTDRCIPGRFDTLMKLKSSRAWGARAA